MTSYFSDASFKFLRALARHNDKAWFNDNRHKYEEHVRQPFLRLITDLQPDLAQVSDHFRSDPRGVGGSLFRIHRDARPRARAAQWSCDRRADLRHRRHAVRH